MKILIFDIETAPKRAFVWGIWEQDIPLNMLISDTYMLCWSAKWLGEKKIMFDRIKDPKSEDDSKIAKSLHALMEEADIVVAHNGNRFDIPVANTIFIRNGLTPPNPTKSIDTKTIAKRNFMFTSNKLDFLGEYLGLGRKEQTGGFELWDSCLKNDPKAWKRMEKYNKQDVILLEKVYLKLRPWMKNHPNVNLDSESLKPACPTCGSKSLRNKGYAYTTTSMFQRFKCNDCGYNMKGNQNLMEKDKRESLLRANS